MHRNFNYLTKLIIHRVRFIGSITKPARESAIVQRKITESDVLNFIRLSGDTNPIHFTREEKRGVVHGAFLNALVSGVLGTKLPGPGTLVLHQILEYPNPCFIGETVTISVHLHSRRKLTSCHYEIIDSTDNQVLTGSAKLRIIS